MGINPRFLKVILGFGGEYRNATPDVFRRHAHAVGCVVVYSIGCAEMEEPSTAW